MNSTGIGIFFGVECIINRYLLDPRWQRKEGRLTNYGHKTNCLLLSGDVFPEFFSAEKMIHEMFNQIEMNIRERKTHPPSLKNWDFNNRRGTDPSAGKPAKNGTRKESTSPEVTLERAIIQARRMHGSNSTLEWTYQMPVAAGIFGADAEKHTNIDLVRKVAEGNFDLIELKVASDNPLYAAVEILQYGLVYVASRKYADEIGYKKENLEILTAKQIRLCVLAPPSFYERRYNLAWLEKGLNTALEQFSKENGYCMLFQFQVLNLTWMVTDRPSDKQLIAINKVLDEISQVNWKNVAG